MPLNKFFNLYKSNQTAFHNLCVHKTPPAGTAQLLWNGLKYCIEKPLPKPNLQKTFERLRADVRLKYFWRQRGEYDDGEYIKKLYVKRHSRLRRLHLRLKQLLLSLRTRSPQQYGRISQGKRGSTTSQPNNGNSSRPFQITMILSTLPLTKVLARLSWKGLPTS